MGILPRIMIWIGGLNLNHLLQHQIGPSMTLLIGLFDEAVLCSELQSCGAVVN